MSEAVPKSMRLHIGIFGRTNVGKSSFLNGLTGQEVAIVSEQAGTTTDPVEKAMELLPLGPVVLTDTGGVDDVSPLGLLRQAKRKAALRRMDIAVLMIEPERWTAHEENLVQEFSKTEIPFLMVVGKCDLHKPSELFMAQLREHTAHVIEFSTAKSVRDRVRVAFVESVAKMLPERVRKLPDLLEGLVSAGEVLVLVIPVDRAAPKGRLILPQAQVVRSALEQGVVTVVARETEVRAALAKLSAPPNLVICDSQVVDRVVAEIPAKIPCTTFSILLARQKGDLSAMIQAAQVLDDLHDGDRILIAEACTHHATEDDIGRVKIPRWLLEKSKKNLQIEVVAGRDWPAELEKFRLVIHCGACMITHGDMHSRLNQARALGVPVTNYGLAISHLKGVFSRMTAHFN